MVLLCVWTKQKRSQSFQNVSKLHTCQPNYISCFSWEWKTFKPTPQKWDRCWIKHGSFFNGRKARDHAMFLASATVIGSMRFIGLIQQVEAYCLWKSTVITATHRWPALPVPLLFIQWSQDFTGSIYSTDISRYFACELYCFRSIWGRRLIWILHTIPRLILGCMHCMSVHVSV